MAISFFEHKDNELFPIFRPYLHEKTRIIINFVLKEPPLQEMEQRAAELGAGAVVGIDLDYETVDQSGSMLMVTASGTAVVVE